MSMVRVSGIYRHVDIMDGERVTNYSHSERDVFKASLVNLIKKNLTFSFKYNHIL